MHLKSVLKKDLNLMELFKGGAIAMIFKIASVIIGFFFAILLSKLVGAEGYGIFSTCWTLLTIGAVFGKLGFDTSIVKFIAEKVGTQKYNHVKPIYKKCILIVLVSSSIVALILLISSGFISNLFFETRDYLNLVQLIAITVIPLTLLNFNAESLKGLKKITAFSVFQNGSIYLITLLFVYLFSLNTVNNSISIYSLSITISLLLAISFIIINRNFNKIQKLSKSSLPYRFNLKKVLNISVPMMFTNSLFLIMSWMDILMLSAYKPESEVGIYNVALKISAVITIALIALNTIALPKYAELFGKKDKEGFRKVVKQTSFLNFSLSLPIFLIIIIFPAFLLGIFGEEYIAGSNALIILAFGQIFSSFSGSTIHILNMTGKEKSVRNILISTSLINIILNAILVPPYGIIGAAIATAFSTILWNVITEMIIFKHLGFLTYPLFSRKAMNDMISKIINN